MKEDLKKIETLSYKPKNMKSECECARCNLEGQPEQPNQNLMIIAEIEGLLSQVNERICKLDEVSPYSKVSEDEQKRLRLRSQALEDIDLFQRTTLFKLRKAFE